MKLLNLKELTQNSTIKYTGTKEEFVSLYKEGKIDLLVEEDNSIVGININTGLSGIEEQISQINFYNVYKDCPLQEWILEIEDPQQYSILKEERLKEEQNCCNSVVSTYKDSEEEYECSVEDLDDLDLEDSEYNYYRTHLDNLYYKEEDSCYSSMSDIISDAIQTVKDKNKSVKNTLPFRKTISKEILEDYEGSLETQVKTYLRDEFDTYLQKGNKLTIIEDTDSVKVSNIKWGRRR